MDSKLILIIDDDPAVLLALTQIFNINDYFVFGVNSGVHAFEVLKSLKVDAIVCDYEMPKMNGLEFLKVVKDRYPEIPIMMLSDYEDSNVKSMAIHLGAKAFLSKPLDFRILLEKLSLLIQNNNSLHNVNSYS